MAGNLFKRYVWLIDLIQRTRGIDYEGINRNWRENYRLNETHEPLPKRTLQNHIKAIYEMFGIEIECNRKRDYKYIIINPEDIEQSQTQRALISHLLLSNIDMEQREKEYVIIPKLDVHRFISPILDAISLQQKIEIYWGWSHEDFDNNQVKDRWVKIEPYYIRGYFDNFNQCTVWYLFGKGDRGAIQVYELNNIKDIVMLNESFCHPHTPFEVIENDVLHTPINQTDQDDSFGICVHYKSEKE